MNNQFDHLETLAAPLFLKGSLFGIAAAIVLTIFLPVLTVGAGIVG